MKIIIQHKGIARTIDGPFQICGSNQDLSHFCETLTKEIDDTKFSYGWVTINTQPQDNGEFNQILTEKSRREGAPLAWREEAKCN